MLQIINYCLQKMHFQFQDYFSVWIDKQINTILIRETRNIGKYFSTQTNRNTHSNSIKNRGNRKYILNHVWTAKFDHFELGKEPSFHLIKYLFIYYGMYRLLSWSISRNFSGFNGLSIFQNPLRGRYDELCQLNYN